MKHILFAIALLLALPAISQNDPAAKALLDKVSKKFKGLTTVQGNYSLTVTTRAGKPAGKKSGQIFVKGAKYKITEQSMQILCDGKKVWKYEPAANEVSVSAVDNSSGAITPQKLFTNFYDKDFLYKLNGPVTVNGKKVQEIEMTPTDKRKSFYKVYVYIDEAQSMIVSSKIYENSGNIYNYSISNLKTNAALADNLFAFDKAKYPGVEVIEQ
ncbi:LolA family protein [Phnomibacter ginsenosidimutans]|uniref:Outer membrane lipoprotein-sorting protein n=1 Tax=Phnomibacter ginsenosidimutans TaxID=2676868 RepID=A0A6I6G557_9BACT|nr:outer membrane lipoprotein carrier protein LolA [Phnomibacter ginsenosidimutans]QGW27776.1 outer membrane lipoprotein-sorting protein [Phnomibacter ginsenosidimutans]